MAILQLTDSIHSGQRAIATRVVDFSRTHGSVANIVNGTDTQYYDAAFSDNAVSIGEAGDTRENYVEFETANQTEAWVSFMMSNFRANALNSTGYEEPLIRFLASDSAGGVSDFDVEVSSRSQNNIRIGIVSSSGAVAYSTPENFFGTIPTTPQKIDCRFAYSSGRCTIQFYRNRVLLVQYSLDTTNFNSVNRVRIYNLYGDTFSTSMYLSEVTYEDTSTLGRRVFSKDFDGSPTNQWTNNYTNVADTDETSVCFATANDQNLVLSTANLPALGNLTVDPYLIRVRGYDAAATPQRLQIQMTNGTDTQGETVQLSSETRVYETLINNSALVTPAAFSNGQVTLTSRA